MHAPCHSPFPVMPAFARSLPFSLPYDANIACSLPFSLPYDVSIATLIQTEPSSSPSPMTPTLWSPFSSFPSCCNVDAVAPFSLPTGCWLLGCYCLVRLPSPTLATKTLSLSPTFSYPCCCEVAPFSFPCYCNIAPFSFPSYCDAASFSISSCYNSAPLFFLGCCH